jgi:hypothetical protein
MPSSTLRHKAALLVVVCLAAVAAGVTTASAKPVFGVQGINPTTNDAALKRDLDAAQRSGVRQLRVHVRWSLLQPTKTGGYDQGYLAAVDRLFAGAAARKLKVVLFVTATPCWASSAPSSAKEKCSGTTTPFDVDRYPPSDVSRFVDVSTFLVARYRADLAGYEIWNEPDQVNENYWAGPNKVGGYVAMVKAAYRPLKDAAPEVPVLAGSFVGGNGKWLQAMYDAGIKGFYDGLAVHFYDLPLYSLRLTRAVQKANGDSTPQWLTEFGWDSCYRKGGPSHRVQHRCVTAKVQGTALRDMVKAIHNTSWIKSAILYQLRDENADYRFGLFDRAGKVKPTYTVLRKLLRGRVAGSLPRPTLRLRARGGRLAASGKASIDDVFVLTLTQNGTLRYRAELRSDRNGAWKLTFPQGIPTSGVKVRITSSWSHAAAAASR